MYAVILLKEDTARVKRTRCSPERLHLASLSKNDYIFFAGTCALQKIPFVLQVRAPPRRARSKTAGEMGQNSNFGPFPRTFPLSEKGRMAFFDSLTRCSPERLHLAVHSKCFLIRPGPKAGGLFVVSGLAGPPLTGPAFMPAGDRGACERSYSISREWLSGSVCCFLGMVSFRTPFSYLAWIAWASMPETSNWRLYWP